jgi:hypothetical protein
VRWPHAVHRSFPSRVKANQWLQETIKSIREPSTRLFDDYLSASSLGLATPTPLNIRESTQSSRRGKYSQAGRLAESETAAPSVPERPPPNGEVKSNASADGSVVLSPEQKKVLQMVNEGRNVFFTGSAGVHFSSYDGMWKN